MLVPGRTERKIIFETRLSTQLREEIIHVLVSFRIIFKWGLEDMPGVDRSILCHQLSIIPRSKPIRQKKRHLSNERREFVKQETTTLLQLVI